MKIHYKPDRRPQEGELCFNLREVELAQYLFSD